MLLLLLCIASALTRRLREQAVFSGNGCNKRSKKINLFSRLSSDWMTDNRYIFEHRGLCGNLISKQPVVLIILGFCDFYFIIYISTFIFLFYSHLSAIEPLTIAYILLINIFNIKRVCCRKLTIDHQMKTACILPQCNVIKKMYTWCVWSESKSDAFIRWMMLAQGTQCYPQLIGKMYRFGYMPIKISSNSLLLAACLSASDYPRLPLVATACGGNH